MGRSGASHGGRASGSPHPGHVRPGGSRKRKRKKEKKVSSARKGQHSQARTVDTEISERKVE